MSVLIAIGEGFLGTIVLLLLGTTFPPFAALVAIGFIPCWIGLSILAYSYNKSRK